MIQVQVQTTVELSSETVAKAFLDSSPEKQAAFFDVLARKLLERGADAHEVHGHAIGVSLRRNRDGIVGREFVRALAEGMDR